INIEIYPNNISWIYYFTDLGRFFLASGLDIIKPFPKIISDVFVLRFWDGYRSTHPKQTTLKYELFEKEYGISWEKANKLLIGKFHQKVAGIDSDDIIPLYAHYMYKPIPKDKETFMKEIVEPWLAEIVNNRVK
ncbi:MAG: hypothetical protein Q8R05_05320, partial [Candidatus Omnitrophota bacterium]|nr:hypothetical protein [Candidatus Omnitrophota bacterium]